MTLPINFRFKSIGVAISVLTTPIYGRFFMAEEAAVRVTDSYSNESGSNMYKNLEYEHTLPHVMHLPYYYPWEAEKVLLHYWNMTRGKTPYINYRGGIYYYINHYPELNNNDNTVLNMLKSLDSSILRNILQSQSILENFNPDTIKHMPQEDVVGMMVADIIYMIPSKHKEILFDSLVQNNKMLLKIIFLNLASNCIQIFQKITPDHNSMIEILQKTATKSKKILLETVTASKIMMTSKTSQVAAADSAAAAEPILSKAWQQSGSQIDPKETEDDTIESEDDTIESEDDTIESGYEIPKVPEDNSIESGYEISKVPEDNSIESGYGPKEFDPSKFELDDAHENLDISTPRSNNSIDTIYDPAYQAWLLAQNRKEMLQLATKL